MPITELTTEQLAEVKRRKFDAEVNAGIAANYDENLGRYADPASSRY